MKAEESARFKAATTSSEIQTSISSISVLTVVHTWAFLRHSYLPGTFASIGGNKWVNIIGILLTVRKDNAKSIQGTGKCVAD